MSSLHPVCYLLEFWTSIKMNRMFDVFFLPNWQTYIQNTIIIRVKEAELWLFDHMHLIIWVWKSRLKYNFYPPSWSTVLSFLTESNLNYIFQSGRQKSISKLSLLLCTGIRKNNIVIFRLFCSPPHIVKTFIFHRRRRVGWRQKLKTPQNRLAVYPDSLSCLCNITWRFNYLKMGYLWHFST